MKKHILLTLNVIAISACISNAMYAAIKNVSAQKTAVGMDSMMQNQNGNGQQLMSLTKPSKKEHVLNKINNKIEQLAQQYGQMMKQLGGTPPTRNVSLGLLKHPQEGNGFYYLAMTEKTPVIMNPFSNMRQDLHDLKEFVANLADKSLGKLKFAEFRSGTRMQDPANSEILFELNVPSNMPGAGKIYRLYYMNDNQ